MDFNPVPLYITPKDQKKMSITPERMKLAELVAEQANLLDRLKYNKLEQKELRLKALSFLTGLAIDTDVYFKDGAEIKKGRIFNIYVTSSGEPYYLSVKLYKPDGSLGNRRVRVYDIKDNVVKPAL